MTTIVIDGIFFQINEWSGIAKYWRNLLVDIDNYLFKNNIDDIRVILLVRGRAECIRKQFFQKIQKLPVSYFDDRCAFSDYLHTGNLCKDLRASVFISSYYTLAYGVPNVGMAYDFIPEHLNISNSQSSWLLRSIYMQSVSCTLSISNSTAKDASTFYPAVQCTSKDIFYPRVTGEEFRQASTAEQNSFREKYSLNYPFLSIIGHRACYKNLRLLTTSVQNDKASHISLPLGVVMSSGEELTDEEQCYYNKHFIHGVKRFNFNQSDLTCLLSCSEMLFYPSLLEGFGYPILEAMAQGCPVVTTSSTSMSEILKHALPEEYRIISGYDSLEAYNAIISILHSRVRVSSESRTRLSKAFGQDYSESFLRRLIELSKSAKPPLDEYLPPCLALDGILN
jgi:glycosyltransferase involved in cell wall biosynthesis